MIKISEDIFLGKNIVETLEEFLRDYDKILVFSNDTVYKIHGEKIKNICLKQKSKEDVFSFCVLDGEEYKNLDSISSTIAFMIEKNFTRKSLVISLGGGVVCDMGGFIASIYMRGIDFIQIPTSLLAQVDASIGGKVAVNFNNVKNVIGHFKMPKKVLIDIDFLKTLSKKEFLSGLAELIKHGFLIKDKGYLSFIESNELNDENLLKIIEQSLRIKKDYVDKDPEEKNIRAFLNLGHTYAHALESYYDYKVLSHGEAVAKGIIFELLLSLHRGLVDKVFLAKAINIFNKFNIACQPLYIASEDLYALCQKDKKNSFNNVVMLTVDKEHNISKTNVTYEEIKFINNLVKENIFKASIDIGTNSCRLFIAEFNGNKYIKSYVKELRTVKLGEDVDKNKYLKDTAKERTLRALKEFVEIIHTYYLAIEDVKCFATSATRDSQNREEFIKKVYDETKLKIKCISGDEEAKYNFLGVMSEEDNKKYLIVDIGGGSTEFIYGSKREGILFSKSVDIGCVRLTEKFLSSYSEDKIKSAYNYSIKLLKDELALLLAKNEIEELIGVAGTITTQITVRDKIINYDSDLIHNKFLLKSELEENIKNFIKTQAKDIVGLDPKRADVIIGGSLILKAILNIFNKDRLKVSENDNLLGSLIYEMEEEC